MMIDIFPMYISFEIFQHRKKERPDNDVLLNTRFVFKGKKRK
jgi:hypothetical protein